MHIMTCVRIDKLCRIGLMLCLSILLVIGGPTTSLAAAEQDVHEAPSFQQAVEDPSSYDGAMNVDDSSPIDEDDSPDDSSFDRPDSIFDDTSFSPVVEGDMLSITPEEAMTMFGLGDKGDYHAQYLSAPNFEAVLQYALQFEGWKYVWGGKNPRTGFDCSGIVSYVYNQVLGANMYTYASLMFSENCWEVSAADARPGDLVFWRGTYGSLSRISHVAIYCGNDIVYGAGDPIGFFKIRVVKNIAGGVASYTFARVKSVDNGNVATALPILDRYSLVFDNDFYSAYNPEMAWCASDPSSGLSSFMGQGMYRGLRGSAVFDVAYYKSKYADLRAAFGNDMRKYYDHYVSNGCKEGRQGSAEFDLAFYKASNPDLRAAFGTYNPSYVLHFINFGMREGRKGSQGFSVLNYRNHYPDLQNAFGNRMGAYYAHYLRYGKSEGRTGSDPTVHGTTVAHGTNYSAIYDYATYISANPDVKRAFAGDPINTLDHFVNYGMSEGRKATNAFDVKSYYNANPDLRRVFGTNVQAITMHYASYGKREGRTCLNVPTLRGYNSTYAGINYAPVYDGAYYCAKYTDLQRAFNVRATTSITLFDDTALLVHFVNYGMSEGRHAKASFNVRVYRAKHTDLQRAFGSMLKDYYLHYITYGLREGRNAA